jgi:hypothetical protein
MVNNMKTTIKLPKKRTWMAKLKAQTMEHRATKRNRTRSQQNQNWKKEYAR